MKLTLHQQLSQPVLTEMLSQRPLGWATLGALGVHFGLIAAGLPGWNCPFRHTLGIPCPGCGLSRAIVALWQGDIQRSFSYHAFAVPVLLLVGLLIVASLLPHHPRDWIILRIAAAERRWALVATGLAILFGYWLVRLIFFNTPYIALISN
jgi:hypothetical protein